MNPTYDADGKLITETVKFLDSSVFYSGRGAGILPAVNDNSNNNLPLGGLKLLQKTEGKAGESRATHEHSLHVDGGGHLSFRKFDKEGNFLRTEINVDKIVVGTLELLEGAIQDVKIGENLLLREEIQEPLSSSSFSGMIIGKYQKTDEEEAPGRAIWKDIALLVDNQGRWQSAERNRTIWKDDNGDIHESVIADSWYNNYILPFFGISRQEDLDTVPETTPVLFRKADGTLQPWTPASLKFKYGSQDIDYNPVGDYKEINIQALSSIKVTTVSYEDIDNPDAVGAQSVQFDAKDGIIDIRLPVPTEDAISSWNGKLDGINFNGSAVAIEEVEADGQKKMIANITHNPEQNPVDYFPSINFTDTETNTSFTATAAENVYNISYTPVYSTVKVEDNTLTLEGEGSRQYTLKHTNTYNSTIQDTAIEVSSATITVYETQYNASGHATSTTSKSYNIGSVITELKNKIQELENKINALTS